MAGDAGHLFLNIKLLKSVEMGKEERGSLTSLTSFDWRNSAFHITNVHHRMPVILESEDYDLWLDPSVTDARLVADCLSPFDPRMMRKYPVSKRVNRPRTTTKSVRG